MCAVCWRSYTRFDLSICRTDTQIRYSFGTLLKYDQRAHTEPIYIVFYIDAPFSVYGSFRGTRYSRYNNVVITLSPRVSRRTCACPSTPARRGRRGHAIVYHLRHTYATAIRSYFKTIVLDTSAGTSEISVRCTPNDTTTC